MKEVHELSLDLYEAKIGTYVRDIIPVEETNEIVRTERSGIPFPKPFAKWKSQNPNAKLKKPITQNYISSTSSLDEDTIQKPSKLQVTSIQKEKTVTMTIMTNPNSPTTSPKDK